MAKKSLFPALIKLAFLPAILLFLNSSFSYDVKMSPYVEHGLIQYSKGNFDRAIDEFSEGIRYNSKDYVAYFERAKAYEQKGRFSDAISDYSQVIKVGPKCFLYHHALYYQGLLYHRNNLFNNAIVNYSAIIDTNCQRLNILANSYNNRGLAYARLNKYSAAAVDYSKAIDLIPDLLNAHYNRGVAYTDMGMYALALRDFDAELAINPNCITAMRYKSAVVYYNQRNYGRSWFQVFALTQSGERVSPNFIADLKKKRKGPSATVPSKPDFLMSGSVN